MKYSRAIPLLLIVLVAAAYIPVLECGFVDFDDYSHVRQNPLVVNGLQWSAVGKAFTQSQASLWVPLTWISFMLDISMFGMNPTALHVVNVLLHIANVLVLFFLLRGLSGRVWPAAAVAACFGLHPLNVESVVWIAERKNVLCGFFFLLSLLLYQAYVKRSGWKWYLATWGAAVLALLAKPMAVTLPFVFLLLDYGPLNRLRPENWKRVLAEKLPFFALSIASCVVTVLSASRALTTNSLTRVTFGNRIRNAAISYTDYLTDIFWPTDLAVLYPHKFVIPWTPALIAMGVLLGATVVAYRLRKHFRYLLWGWLWFLGVLVPMIGLVQAGPQARADRFTYLAQIGIFVAVAFLAADLFTGARRRYLYLGSVIVVAALVATTGQQISHWTHTAYLFEHTARVTTNNTRALLLAANARMELGDYRVAVGHLIAAAKLHPENDRTWISLGTAFSKLNHEEEAQKCFHRALRIDPGSYDANLLLATSIGRSGDRKAAISRLEALADAHPSIADTHYRLSEFLLANGDSQGAKAHRTLADQLVHSSQTAP